MNRLLVVDDDAKTRVKVREYAASEGYMVTEAKDGLEAVRLCQRLDFEAIVMDIIMPNLDGFSACKAIRNKKKIPILILSGRGDEKGKLLGFKLGIDDFMVKPFSPKGADGPAQRHRGAEQAGWLAYAKRGIRGAQHQLRGV